MCLAQEEQESSDTLVPFLLQLADKMLLREAQGESENVQIEQVGGVHSTYSA